MTKLSPLEEALFQTWTRAQGIDNHDDPNNQFDHRGLYKQSGGLILPMNTVNSMAQAHNKSMEPVEGGDTTYPDPYMAQAEMQGNVLKYQGDNQKEQNKIMLEREKMKHKLMLEQLKLSHQAAEKEKDRQQKQMDAERNRQARAEESQRMREAGVQDAVMQEHFTRSRPQPDPMSGGAPSPMDGGQPPMDGGPMNSPSPDPSMGPPPQSGGLQDQLMQRAMPGGM